MTPPGWYADPWLEGGLRWWDGQAWTGYAWVAPPPDVAGLHRQAGIGRAGFFLVAGYQAIVAVALPFVIPAVVDAFGDAFDDDIDTGDPFGPTTALLPINLSSLLSLVGIILLCVWCHKATTVARQLGIATRHSPGWAVGAWLIPIVQYWFPYQVLADLLPPESRARRRLPWFWTAYLGSPTLAFAGGLFAVWSLAVGLVVGLVALVVALAEARIGVSVIQAVNDRVEVAHASR